MDSAASRFDFLRHQAGAELSPEHLADFQRLLKELRYGRRFQLLIVECVDWHLRKDLIQRLGDALTEAGLTAGQIDLAAGSFAKVADMEAELERLAAQHEVVHITGGEIWFDDARLEAFNLRREVIATIPVRLLLWLDEAMIRRLAVTAPDWWAWRGGVFAFLTQPEARPLEPPIPQLNPIDNRSLAKRSRRIAELRAYLKSDPPQPDEIALPLWDELAGLLFMMGQLGEALRIHTEERLPICERLGDMRKKAVTQGKIADILQTRGQLDEALHILTEEALPVFERLGDMSGKAITYGKIADILQAKGQFEEALRIRIEEELPMYERLGDVRSRAITQSKIADILVVGGHLNEALRMRTVEELPVFERLGDVREKALTQGRIADIFVARGQLDEALRIYIEEQLPIYERMGYVSGKASVLFKIALIEQKLGQQAKALAGLAEAFRIFEQLQIAEWLSTVGEHYGALLCASGDSARGLQVLETALQAATQLGQTDRIQRLQERIGKLRA